MEPKGAMNPAAELVVFSKPSFSRKLRAHDVPSSAYRDISAVLGANFKCFVSGCRADCKERLRGVQLICQSSGIFNPIFNSFRLEPLKDTAVPKTSEENVAKPESEKLGVIAAPSYRWLAF